MIRVTVMYPNVAGAHFDHDYYRDRHMPLIQKRLGDACRSYSIDRGLSGQVPGSEPPYVCMCHILSDSLEEFQASFWPHAGEIEDDVANYTEIVPIMQFSAVAE